MQAQKERAQRSRRHPLVRGSQRATIAALYDQEADHEAEVLHALGQRALVLACLYRDAPTQKERRDALIALRECADLSEEVITC